MSPTRRLAAILAADVAGYSRLVGQDEEGTIARLQAVRRELIDPTIAKHHGRIFKTTGDGMLVEFASVVDAVRCAVEVQRAMADRNHGLDADKRIEFRVGINVGDIVIDGSDILGDGVNVAARLEGMAEPGGICVSARVQEDVQGKLDIAFEDMGELELKNIMRLVRVYRIRPLFSSPPLAQSLPSLPDKPSIAVLAFDDMAGSTSEKDFLADGIAEDVITLLSRYPSLFVIARNSSFSYKGRAIDVKQVGRELGVRYVLEGSLRKAGNRIRVTAQLVEAENGRHVWAERYDRNPADIFAVQDEIAGAVTIAVAPAIAQAELGRAMRKPPDNLDAWTAYQRGLWHLSNATEDDNGVAQRLFQQAIDFDHNFAGGYIGLAWALFQAAVHFQVRKLEEAQSVGETLARRAVALDSANAEGHVCLANVVRMRGDLVGALSEAERALAICPNLASAHGELGTTLVYSGRAKEGVTSLERSVRLDPRDPQLAWRLNWIAVGHYCDHEYHAAADAAERAIRSYPELPMPYRWLAASWGQLGRVAEAQEVLAKAIAIRPSSFELFVRKRVPWHRPQDYEHMLEGLRKAGWEGSATR
jgi:adenylate cyclase